MITKPIQGCAGIPCLLRQGKCVFYSLFILILLVNLPKPTSSDIRQKLRRFDTLHKSKLSHNIVKRGLDPER